MSDAREIQSGGDVVDGDDAGDGLLARIGALPKPVLDPGAQARVQEAARAAYRDAAVSPLRARQPSWARAWNRVLEPILVTGVVAGYLAWTAAALGALR